ncbi:MAG: hypothetical protein ACI4XS_05010 [Bacillus sp. (in: firmicutes)]
MIFNEKMAIAKNEVPESGSMARNWQEVKELGKQMDEMLTNKELKKQGLKSDPQQ